MDVSEKKTLPLVYILISIEYKTRMKKVKYKNKQMSIKNNL
jgi:hypothetical protein